MPEQNIKPFSETRSKEEAEILDADNAKQDGGEARNIISHSTLQKTKDHIITEYRNLKATRLLQDDFDKNGKFSEHEKELWQMPLSWKKINLRKSRERKRSTKNP